MHGFQNPSCLWHLSRLSDLVRLQTRYSLFAAASLLLSACGGGSTPTAADAVQTVVSSINTSQVSTSLPPVIAAAAGDVASSTPDGVPNALLTTLPNSQTSPLASPTSSDLARIIDPAANIALTVMGPKWSDPTTWGGQLPPTGASIVIPKGKTVVLDRAVEVANLEINGTLIFDAVNVELRAGTILVNGGLLQIGTESLPFAQRATITLTGTPADQNASVNGCGLKHLCVKGGGKLDLHGTSRNDVSWTKINGTLMPRATTMQLVDPVRWAVGSELALAPSGYDNGQHERLTVTAVSADGLRVSFLPELKYEHFGVVQTIEGRAVDQRAEVALLTRNIVVRSDPSTVRPFSTRGKEVNYNLASELAADPKDRFGGHVMVMDGFARVEGVSFKDLGQATHLGRYAFHWHKTGEGSGQYIKNSSVDGSYTRGIVVHDTNNALVERNVVYNSISHNFIFSESGSETGNVFRGNFGLGTYSFPLKHRIFVRPSNSANDAVDALRSQDENRPSNYWGLNSNNIFIDNVAAGGEGQGFFFAGANQSDLSKFQFTGNVAHSIFSGTGGNDLYPPETRGHGFFVAGGASAKMNPKSFLAYKNSTSAAWLESGSVTLSDSILADNNAGVIAINGRIENSLIIGQSANTNGQPTSLGSGLSGGIHLGPADQAGPKIAKVSNVTFVNQRDGAFTSPDHLLPLTGYAEKIRLVNTQPVYLRGAANVGTMGGFRDLDGSLSGTGQPSVLLGKNPLQADASCTLRQDWSAYICPSNFTNRLVVLQIADAWIPGSPLSRREYWNIGAKRDDGFAGKMYIEGISGGRPAVVLKSRHYDLDFSEIGNTGTNPGPYAKAKIMWVDNSQAALPEDSSNWVTLSFVVDSGQAWIYPLELKPYGTERAMQFPKYDAPVAMVSSRAALASSSTNAWWFDATTKKVYVKVTVGSGPMYVCETQSCT